VTGAGLRLKKCGAGAGWDGLWDGAGVGCGQEQACGTGAGQERARFLKFMRGGFNFCRCGAERTKNSNVGL